MTEVAASRQGDNKYSQQRHVAKGHKRTCGRPQIMLAVTVATVQQGAAPDVDVASIFALTCPRAGLLGR